MYYLRRIFKQDLEKNHQIAFTKEPSYTFFEFDYKKAFETKETRKITLIYNDFNSDSISSETDTITSTLHAASSEARTTAELRNFLQNKYDVRIDDLLLFKKITKNKFEFSFIQKGHEFFNSFNTILTDKNNHQLIIEDDFLNFDESKNSEQINPPEIKLLAENFHLYCSKLGLIYTESLITRFLSSLLTKPFVILTGLSGSGKTKLALTFAEWICKNEEQFDIIPVGADWTNRDHLLGYPNALDKDDYIKPNSCVIDLIQNAEENQNLPHFIILDEMNLSHVERYFSDFLSVMESNKPIKLYDERLGNLKHTNPTISLPPNLFIIGTVNVDETTNMFSPKVLDRANTIEFRISEKEIGDFLNRFRTKKINSTTQKGSFFGEMFIAQSKLKNPYMHDNEAIDNSITNFFTELQNIGAEFGYRTVNDMLILMNQLKSLEPSITIEDQLDIAIVQKLLPKIHGSQRKLRDTLSVLASFCFKNRNFKPEESEKFFSSKFDANDPEILYKISLEKIHRMYNAVQRNGYTSFAEA